MTTTTKRMCERKRSSGDKKCTMMLLLLLLLEALFETAMQLPFGIPGIWIKFQFYLISLSALAIFGWNQSGGEKDSK